MSKPLLLVILLTLVTPFAFTSAADRGVDKSFTRGLYVLDHPRKGLDEKAMAHPAMIGLAVRVTWEILEPEKGRYDWEVLDKRIALARRHGKAVSLLVKPGVATPDWVYAQGAQSYDVKRIVPKPLGRGAQLVKRAPIPVDPVYLESWSTFIRNVGRRYGRLSELSHVKIAGMNSSTGEYGRLGVDRDGAKALVVRGCDRFALLEAHKQIVGLFKEAFPTKRLTLVMGSHSFGVFDDPNGPKLRDELREWTVDFLGPDRAVIQNCGLVGGEKWSRKGAKRALQDEVKWEETHKRIVALKAAGRCEIGYQTGWAASDDPNRRMGKDDTAGNLRMALDRAWSDSPAFYEIWQQDILNADGAVQQILRDYAKKFEKRE